MWCRPGPGPGLLVLTGMNGGSVAVVDLQVLALRGGPDALVAVGGHDVEDFHLALHDLVVGAARRRISSCARPP